MAKIVLSAGQILLPAYYINVCIYAYMSVCMYVLFIYVCIYLFILFIYLFNHI